MGTHHDQKVFGEYHTDQCENGAADQGCGQHGMDSLMYGFFFFSTQCVGDRNTGTDGQTDKQIDDQVGNRTGSAYCRYGNTTTKSANHNQVSRVE